jgi:uncharacterized protein YcnI
MVMLPGVHVLLTLGCLDYQPRRLRLTFLGIGLIVALLPGAVLAHIEVVPAESTAGEMQRYGIRVPTEKPSPTVRVEVQFPSALRVVDFEAVAGWQLTFQTDAAARPLDAIWQGGSIPPNQFAEFGLRAQNPDGEADLRWTVIQTYADGSEVQWVGPPTANFPAAFTRVHRRRLAGWTVALVGLGVVLSLIATAVSVLGWRAGRSVRSVAGRLTVSNQEVRCGRQPHAVG